MTTKYVTEFDKGALHAKRKFLAHFKTLPFQGIGVGR